MFKRVFSLCLILLAFQSIASEHTIEVTIDNSSLTATDIKERSKLIIFSSGMPNNQKSYNLMHDKVREILIDEILIAKEALKYELEIEPGEIEKALALIASRNNISPHEIVHFFRNKNISESELKKQLKHQILWSKIVANFIQPNIVITDREIDESRIGIERAAQTAAQVADLKLAEIVLYYHNEEEEKKSKDFAHKLVSQIKLGADFSKMAKEFSQAQSAGSYGEIGWVPSNQIQPNLAGRLMKLSIGSMETIQLEDGIHIFKLLGKKNISSPLQNISSEEIKNFLIERKMEIAVKAYLRKLRKSAHIQLLR